MKKLIYSLLLAVGLAAIVTACNDHTGSAVTGEKKKKHMDSVGAVLTPRDTAISNIKRFLTMQGSYLKGIVIRGYTIRAVDLFGALGIPGSYVDSPMCRYTHIRVYLGLDRDSAFRLYILPTKNVSLDSSQGGQDLYLDSLGNILDPTTQVAASPFVLDLNAPCPNTCATNPPLLPLPNERK